MLVNSAVLSCELGDQEVKGEEETKRETNGEGKQMEASLLFDSFWSHSAVYSGISQYM